MKMSLGMEVGLCPGDFVLDGDPDTPLPKKEAEPGGGAPNFRFMSIVAKRLDGSRWHLAKKHQTKTAKIPRRGAQPPRRGARALGLPRSAAPARSVFPLRSHALASPRTVFGEV